MIFPYPVEGPGRDEFREKLRSDLLIEIRRAVRARLASLEREWAEGYRADKIEAVTVLEGFAAQMILLEAERMAADMILVFNSRRSPLRRLLHGSVAQQVVAGARIPVVVQPIVEAGLRGDSGERGGRVKHLRVILNGKGAGSPRVRAAFAKCVKRARLGQRRALSVGERPGLVPECSFA